MESRLGKTEYGTVHGKRLPSDFHQTSRDFFLSKKGGEGGVDEWSE
jgi:hypothetical protein